MEYIRNILFTAESHDLKEILLKNNIRLFGIIEIGKQLLINLIQPQ